MRSGPVRGVHFEFFFWYIIPEQLVQWVAKAPCDIAHLRTAMLAVRVQSHSVLVKKRSSGAISSAVQQQKLHVIRRGGVLH